MHAPLYCRVNPHAYPHPLRVGDTVTTEGRDFEWHVIVPYVAVEPTGRWGYGVARRALRGPKWVMPAAILRNSSSVVCRACHSSSVTYFQAERRFCLSLGGGEGNRGFFVVLGKVVDDEVWARLVTWSREARHNHGSQCFDVSFGVDARVGSDRECVAVTVVNRGVAPSTLYLGGVVVASPVLAAELDDGGVGGVADGGRDVTRRCHRECAWLSWSWRQASAIVFQKGRSPIAVFAEPSWSGRGEEATTFLKVSLVSGLFVKGVDHVLGDGLAFRLSHGGFFVGGCFGGIVVCSGPGIPSFFSVKVPVGCGRGTRSHGRDAKEWWSFVFQPTCLYVYFSVGI